MGVLKVWSKQPVNANNLKNSDIFPRKAFQKNLRFLNTKVKTMYITLETPIGPTYASLKLLSMYPKKTTDRKSRS